MIIFTWSLNAKPQSLDLFLLSSPLDLRSRMTCSSWCRRWSHKGISWWSRIWWKRRSNRSRYSLWCWPCLNLPALELSCLFSTWEWMMLCPFCVLCFALKVWRNHLRLLLSLGEFGIECLFQVNQTLIKLVTRNFL